MVKKKIVLFNLWIDNNVGYFDAIILRVKIRQEYKTHVYHINNLL